MKTIIKNFIRLLFTIVIFSGAVFSQSKTETTSEKLESPYDELNLTFALGADPTPEAVGFDDPKSRWKFSYELLFLENEKAALEKAGYKYWQENPNETAAERAKRIERSNKQFNKAWKKFGVRVAKGRISKTSLLSEENREVIIPVRLPLEIKNILARANSTNAFPDFRIQIKGMIYSKTKSNLKFKQRFSQSYTCPTKMIVKGAPAWMMNTCGTYLGVTNQNGKIYINSL
jgi:hypothetical protein